MASFFQFRAKGRGKGKGKGKGGGSDGRSNRDERARIAAETLQICQQGVYQINHQQVTIDVSRCARDTMLFASHLEVPPRAAPPVTHRTVFRVVNVGSLSAARQLVRERQGAEDQVAVLNFASAKHPGGGWLNGSEAQEENLARASSLYHALASDASPARHHYSGKTGDYDGLYTHTVIHSPHVVVFRDDRTSALLEESYEVTMLTAAAPNAGRAVKAGVPREEIVAVLRARACRVLDVAASMGHRALVLGAWGCGVFGNDPDDVVAAFADQLLGSGSHAASFDVVVFAVIGPRANLIPFEARFGSVSGLARAAAAAATAADFQAQAP